MFLSSFTTSKFVAILFLGLCMISCDSEDIPEKENEEVIEEEQEEEKEEEVVPVLDTPTVSIFGIEMDWVDFEGATAYEIDVATDHDFTSIFEGYNSRRVAQSQHTVKGLLPETTYYLRIRAILADRTKTGFSNVVEATTIEYDECKDPANFLFAESDGIIKIEFENAAFSSSWVLRTDIEGATGEGYMVWTGADFFPRPVDRASTFNISISTPGTYRFLWYNAYTIGDNGTEHNDTWLKFPDAEDYYASKGDGKVYPKGVGKTPNPEGASADGWFKIYRSGNDKGFKWQARTYDRDPHQIYVTFDQAKVYKMEVSARSNGHGVDKFLLHLDTINETDAINADFSEILCF